MTGTESALPHGHPDQSSQPDLPGALVISLDFELHWGFCDRRDLDEGLKEELLNARRAVERLLELFSERGIHATWAAVGFLMLEGRDQLETIAPRPDQRPRYHDASLDPYRVAVGGNESVDPWHFAPSLVKKICAAPGQELATHTFSHYYCLEPGQDEAAFAADTKAAAGAARLHGQQPRTVIFPRNQHNPAYGGILRDCGIEAYRGNPEHPLYRSAASRTDRLPWRRAGRLLDSYLNLSGHHLQPWEDLRPAELPMNVRASRFFRPWSRRLQVMETLKIARIRRGIRAAAGSGSIFHLWWHPHNFASNMEKNMANLRLIFDEYKNCRIRYGMRSLNIGEIVDMVKSPESAG